MNESTGRFHQGWSVCMAALLIFASPSVARASGEIVFASQVNGSLDLWTISPDRSSRTNLSAVSHDPLGIFDERVPRWSPDGSRIAFISIESGSPKVWIMNPDGSDDFQVTPPSSLAEQGPTWGPDGRHLYFARNTIFSTGAGCGPCPHWEIWSHDLDTGAESQLTADFSRDVSPVISPDGQIVVFAKAENANDCCNPTNLWQMGPNGEFQSQLFPPSGDPNRYEWPADWSEVTGLLLGGKQFGSSATNAYEIVLFDLDGSADRLTNNSVYDFPVAFSPGEDEILFSSNRTGTFELFIGSASNPDLSPFQLTSEGPISGADWKSARNLSCTGFEPPLSAGPVTIRGKNRVLPLRATLTDSSGASVTSADLTSPPIVQVLFDPGTGAPWIDVTEFLTSVGHGNEGVEFTFTDEDLWQLNLKAGSYDMPGTYRVALISGDLREYRVDPACWATFLLE